MKLSRSISQICYCNSSCNNRSVDDTVSAEIDAKIRTLCLEFCADSLWSIFDSNSRPQAQKR